MSQKKEETPGHITIALAVYNGEDTVSEAVKSLLGQSYQNFDLFVVDDASTDGTFTVLQSLLPEDRRLHVVRLDKNAGTYSAKNLVLREFCRGEFFAHQDADDISWEQRLERQVNYLNHHLEVAACGTGIDEFYADQSSGPTTPSDYPPEFEERNGFFHRKNLYDPWIPRGACFDYSIENLAHIKIAMNGSMLFRAAELKGLGGFDGRTWLAGDTELFWRLLVCHPLGNLQEVLYSRRFHSASLTKSKTYGFGSDMRTRYAQKIKAHMMKLQEFYRRGDTVALTEGTTQDMYVAQGAYQVFHGGS